MAGMISIIAELGLALMTKEFVKRIVMTLLKKLAESTKTDLDNEIVAAVEAAWKPKA